MRKLDRLDGDMSDWCASLFNYRDLITGVDSLILAQRDTDYALYVSALNTNSTFMGTGPT